MANTDLCAMNNRQLGMILVWTSVMLLLLSLLILAGLQRIQIDTKMMHYHQQWQMSFYTAQAGLLAGENRVMQQSYGPCVVAMRDANFYPQTVAAWAINLECALDLNQTVSYYVIEDLGRYPCIQLDQIEEGSSLTIAHFYRITAQAALPEQMSVVVQSTFVVGEYADVVCQTDLIQVINQGRQSWREYV